MSGIDDVTKRRFKKGYYRRRKDAVQLSQQADQQIERLLIRRFDRLLSVRRFIFLWVSLFGLLFFCGFLQLRALSPYYQKPLPVPGGLYNEGIVGSFTNANPVYATGTADSAASRLIFSGLFKYDNNNSLVSDLAKDWRLSTSQTRYVVHLKQGIRWHDGRPFTADDVVFTYRAIQDIESQSSLYASWIGIKVTKLDSYTVVFELPNPLSSFPHALTNGIIPFHLLKKIPPAGMRSAAFNTAPIGTGPFRWRFVEVTNISVTDKQQRISLEAYDNYHGGRPKLDGISLITFSDDQQMLKAFKKKQLNAMSGLDSLPEELANDTNIEAYNTPLSGAAMAFFNTSHEIINDVSVRRALVSGIDRSRLNSLFKYPVNLVDSPLLPNQLGYDPSAVELPYNFAQANQILDQAGWARDRTGQRLKAGKPLELSLSSLDSQEYTQTAQFLQRQWGHLGVKTIVHYYSSDDLQTSIIGNHDYDILLYGISIGVDPDVFAYWHSSQASLSSQGHLNLSEYKSTAVDQALEGARTRADPATRIVKYKAFLDAWRQDAPALALYQPNFLYVARGPVFGYTRKASNSSVDRFYNVNQWMIRQQKQTI